MYKELYACTRAVKQRQTKEIGCCWAGHGVHLQLVTTANCPTRDYMLEGNAHTHR